MSEHQSHMPTRKAVDKHTAGRSGLKMTDAARPATFVVDARNEHGETVQTAIAGEHPLTIYLDKREIVTLMTLGQAPEALAIGYLRNQRLVRSISDIVSVQVDWETAACAIRTSVPRTGIAQRLRKRTVTTGCGQGTVFGDLMEKFEEIELPNRRWHRPR